MEELLKELRQDIKEIKIDISGIKEDVATNTASLHAHMARTELNEARIQKLEYWLLGLLGTAVLALIGIALK